MMHTFGEWLKSELDKRDMTQSELAQKIDVHPPQVSRIISGERLPTTQLLIKIADALMLPREQVFSAAGILSPRADVNEKIEEIIHLASRLSDEDKEAVIDFIGILDRLRGQKKK